MPIDLQLRRPSPISNLANAMDKHQQIISSQLQQRWIDAQQNIMQRQQQQQERYNKDRPGISYQIGDKVLLFNVTQSHIHGDKFKDKFDGPFYIHDIVRPGTFKLRTLDGRVRKNPIHADLLKPYLERTEWEPQIIIE